MTWKRTASQAGRPVTAGAAGASGGVQAPGRSARSNPLSRLLTLLPFVVVAAAARPAAAQRMRSGTPVAAQDSTVAEPSFPELLVPAMLGAAGGVYVGVRLGEQVGWGGGEDPGLLSAALFGSLAGAFGSLAFAGAASGVELDAGSALASLLVGTAAGAVGAFIGANLGSGGGLPVILGYSLGQGSVTAGILSAGR